MPENNKSERREPVATLPISDFARCDGSSIAIIGAVLPPCKTVNLDSDAVCSLVLDRLKDGDWDDVLRIFRAAVDPDAQLIERDGDFCIQTTSEELP
jgi:hypothetical protein